VITILIKGESLQLILNEYLKPASSRHDRFDTAKN